MSPQTLSLLGSSRGGIALVTLVHCTVASNFLEITSGMLIARSSLTGYKVRLTLEFLVEEEVGDEILGIAGDPFNS